MKVSAVAFLAVVITAMAPWARISRAGDSAVVIRPDNQGGAEYLASDLAPPARLAEHKLSPVGTGSDNGVSPAPVSPAAFTEEQSSAASCPNCPSCANSSCSCESEPNCFLDAGVEATFLWTHTSDGASGNPAPNQLAASQFASVEGKYDASPRIWLGVENCRGWGVRASYWSYMANDSSSGVSVGPPLLFDVTNASGDASLRAFDIDLEVTRRKEFGYWSVLGTGGIRYADLHREEKFDVYSTTNDAFASTDSTREIHGTGLTSALEARRPIGDCGFGLMFKARGSVLWGSDDADANGILTLPGIHSLTVVQAQENNPLYIAEFQAGIDWNRHIEWFPGYAFAKLAFEYQHWDSSDAETPFNFSKTLNTSNEFGRSLSSDVSFTGLAFSVGFTR